jgi:phage host-nuclease inhibitor protein Gam
MDADLFDVLKQLALTVKKTIDEGISNGTIQPEEEEFRRWKVDKFQYTDKGIIESSAHDEYITKKVWIKATHKLKEPIEKSDEYSSNLEELTTVFGKNNTLSKGVEKFIGKIIHQRLYDSNFDNADIDALITTLLKDLREEPVRCGANVELDGILMQPEKIDIVDGVTIRQPKIEDLEKEYLTENFMMHFLPNPSAILNIEFFGRQPREIQRRVVHAIAILRLFKVVSVKYTSYRMYSDSMTTFFGGTLSSGDTLGALETYLITPEDVPKLKHFWLRMSDSIPESFYETGITKTHV